MKRKLSLSFLCAALLSSSAYAADPVLLTTQEWEPYQYTENGELKGIAVKVVKSVLEEMKQPYKIEVYPWKRAQEMAKAGDAQGFFASSRSAERDGYAVLSDIIADQQWVWVSLQKRGVSPKAPDFKQKGTVAALFGSAMYTYLKDNGFKISTTANTTEQLLSQLEGGRVDAILVNQLVFETAIGGKYKKDDFSIVLEKDAPLGVYFTKAFLAKNPDFLGRFNAALKKVKK